MLRELKKIGLAGLLLLSLCHAWFGHDLIHGHHHQDLGEATYSTSTQRVATADLQVHLLTLATLVSFYDLTFHAPRVIVELRDENLATVVDPQFLERIHSPRAPPAFSFFV